MESSGLRAKIRVNEDCKISTSGAVGGMNEISVWEEINSERELLLKSIEVGPREWHLGKIRENGIQLLTEFQQASCELQTLIERY